MSEQHIAADDDTPQWSNPISMGARSETAWTLYTRGDGPSRIYYGSLYRTEQGYSVIPAWEVHPIAYFDPMMPSAEAKSAAVTLLVLTHDAIDGGKA